MFGIDLQVFSFWKDVVLLGWAFAVSGFVIWDRRNKVTQDAIQTLRHEVARELARMQENLDIRRQRIDEAIDALRSRVAATPARSDLAHLYKSINEVAHVANELRGVVGGVQNTLQMINQHLLDK